MRELGMGMGMGGGWDLEGEGSLYKGWVEMDENGDVGLVPCW